jgi:prepilin signal peptidase PulO-like enzyme (type II secretory pathway)
MQYAILFFFGLAIGSFLNVLALRYDGERFVFNPKVIGGRSRCPHCKRTLRWFELVPVLSFVVQRGKCRKCRARLSFQYPIVELLSGLIFVLVPCHFAAYSWPFPIGWCMLSGLWIAAFEILLLISVIDMRLQIVPDELSIMLGAVALLTTIFTAGYLGASHQSFLGPYASIFGLYNNIWLSHLVGAIVGGGFFWVLARLTPYIFKIEGMGMGDVKLGIPLGFLFGWPDIVLLYAAAFIIGSIIGVGLIVAKVATRKSAVPFVPFLAAGSVYVFFFGERSVEWYFRIMGL